MKATAEPSGDHFTLVKRMSALGSGDPVSVCAPSRKVKPKPGWAASAS